MRSTMFYSAPTLTAAIASGDYRISAGIGSRRFGIYSEDAHAAMTPGETFYIRHVGPARLRMLTHGWSGTALIVGNGSVAAIDLYSHDPGDLWIDLPASPGAIAETTIVAGGGPANPASGGGEAWLIGIAFAEHQPWQVTTLPLSPHADMTIGHYGTFLMPSADNLLSPTLKHDGVWAPRDLELFASFLKPGDTVIDAGANIGHHTVALSQMVGRAGKVLAFEPQQLIYRFACGNLAINRCDNATLLPMALGDEDGWTRMTPIQYNEPQNFGGPGLPPPGEPADQAGERMRITRFDTLIASGEVLLDRLDFIKIDIQGYELFALRGALTTLQRFRPRLFVELSPLQMQINGYDYRDIYLLLRDLGYCFKHLDPGGEVIDGVRQWTSGLDENWDVYCAIDFDRY